MKITIDAKNVAKCLIENIDKAGNNNWSICVNSEGYVDCRHDTEDNSDYFDLYNFYNSYGPDDITSDVESMAEWISTDVIVLCELQDEINDNIYDGEKVKLEWK